MFRRFSRIRTALRRSAPPQYPLDSRPWYTEPEYQAAEVEPRPQTVRLIGRDDAVLCEARVSTLRWNGDPADRSNHVHAYLPVGARMPLWYGGHYVIEDTPWYNTGMRNIYFTLPSGLENIWGQGNDFDTDAVRIHPEDLARILEDGP